MRGLGIRTGFRAHVVALSCCVLMLAGPAHAEPPTSTSREQSIAHLAAFRRSLSPIHTVARDDAGSLYFGGDTTQIGDIPLDHVGRWDGTAIAPLGAGLDGEVLTMVAKGRLLYAGGRFTTAGGVASQGVARWDGAAWSAVGGGTNGAVLGLTLGDGEDLYAVGEFTAAGGKPAAHVARWDGVCWHPLGKGVNRLVRTVAVAGRTVYVGGDFTRAGDKPANRIARWDGENWTSLGSGMDDSVATILPLDAKVYAAGWFREAGGVPARRISVWDGASWAPLGKGIGGIPTKWIHRDGGAVLTLAAHGDRLVAGGRFAEAGVADAHHIAVWDGRDWSPLGPKGTVAEWDDTRYVGQVLLRGDRLLAVGRFDRIGGVVARNAAEWDGHDWTPLSPSSDDSTATLGREAVIHYDATPEP